MIAIPNMSKPENCMDCIVEEYADCDICKGMISASKYADRRYEHCTLIEIDDTVWENEFHKLIRMTNERRVNKKLAEVVRCGECKKVDTKKCPMYSAGWGYTDDDWCSEGERRADGNKRRSV